MAILEMSIADNRKKNEQYVTQWFKVVCFGKTAEALAPLVSKGSEIWAKGEYERREFTDKNGNKRVAEQLNASYIRVCVATKAVAGQPELPPGMDGL
jgi:single-stranded DNA-binding protein